MPSDCPEDALAAELEGDPDHARLPRVVASLDQPLTSEATATLGDVVSGDEPPFEDEIAHTLTLGKLDAAIDRLPELERDVVRLRFGLDGGAPALPRVDRALRSASASAECGASKPSALAFLAAQPEVEGVHDAA